GGCRGLLSGRLRGWSVQRQSQTETPDGDNHGEGHHNGDCLTHSLLLCCLSGRYRIRLAPGLGPAAGTLQGWASPSLCSHVPAPRITSLTLDVGCRLALISWEKAHGCTVVRTSGSSSRSRS